MKRIWLLVILLTLCLYTFLSDKSPFICLYSLHSHHLHHLLPCRSWVKRVYLHLKRSTWIEQCIQVYHYCCYWIYVTGTIFDNVSWSFWYHLWRYWRQKSKFDEILEHPECRRLQIGISSCFESPAEQYEQWVSAATFQLDRGQIFLLITCYRNTFQVLNKPTLSFCFLFDCGYAANPNLQHPCMEPNLAPMMSR